MVETLGALPEALGEVSELLADAGYFSEANVAACVEADIDPFIAPPGVSPMTCRGKAARAREWSCLARRGCSASANRRRSVSRPMRWNACGIGSRPAGRASYGKRKQIVEPVFGIITAGTRFRQFLLRGLEAVRGEWSLVTPWSTMVVVSTCAAALPVQPESDRLLGVINFGAFSIYREKPRN
jgi:hypothetical protein